MRVVVLLRTWREYLNKFLTLAESLAFERHLIEFPDFTVYSQEIPWTQIQQFSLPIILWPALGSPESSWPLRRVRCLTAAPEKLHVPSPALPPHLGDFGSLYRTTM